MTHARTSKLAALTIVSASLALSACLGPSSEDEPVESAASIQASQTRKVFSLGTRGEAAQAHKIIDKAAGKWVEYDRPADHAGMAVFEKGFVAMSDGIRLGYTVTLPTDDQGQPVSQPLPTILIQTAYNKAVGAYSTGIGGADEYMVRRGYATVVVDVRGTGNSEGAWEAFGEREQQDYAEMVDWLIQQPWSNGKVGLYGVSYLGITAMLTASRQHPAVKAAMPILPVGDSYRDIVFTGGQVNPTFIPLWMALITGLGALPADAFEADPAQGIETGAVHFANAFTEFQVPTAAKALAGESQTAFDGDFWRVRSPIEQADSIQIPTFVVGGLHDLFQRSEPMWFEQLKDQTTTKLLIGPWAHIESGSGLPADGVPTLKQIQLMWFDQYLKGMKVGADKLPNVTQYIKNHDHYVTASDWPHPKATAQTLYLRNGGALDPSPAETDEAPARILQMPLFGLCSLSLNQWTAGALGMAPNPCTTEDTVDQIPAARFLTPPIAQGLYINGPIAADLWITTTGLDASVSVRLSSVDPASGRSTAITNGLLTASHRAVDDSRSRFMDGQRIQPWHPFTEEAQLPVNPLEPMLVPVELFATSALIPPGHQLQITVNSSNLPQGLPPAESLVKGIAGTIEILNTPEYPSKIMLPVVPVAELGSL